MANGILAFESVGILASRVRHLPLKSAGITNESWNSQLDNKPIQLNRRNFDRTNGSSIAVQIGPNQTVANTNDVIGAEIRARTAGVGTGALAPVKADAVLATATAVATVSAIKCFEANIDFPDSGSAYTITNNINAFRTFLDMGAGHTVSGKKAVFCIATPNTSGWDYLFDVESSSGLHTVASGTYSTAEGYLTVRVAGSVYRMPFFTGTD